MVNGKTLNSVVRRLLVRLAGADIKTKCRVSLSEVVPPADPSLDLHTDPDILDRDLRSPALVFELEPPKGARFTLRLAFLDSDPYHITHDPAGETCTIGAQAKCAFVTLLNFVNSFTATVCLNRQKILFCPFIDQYKV